MKKTEMMKTLISLFMLIAVSAIAQDDCSNYVKVHLDEVSGRSTLINKEQLVVSDENANGFVFMIMESNKAIIMSIKAIDNNASRCIEDKSEINILFTDGTRIKIFTDNKFNCQSTATVYFFNLFGKRDAYDKLISKDVDIMRVWTSKGYVQKKFTADQAKQLRNTLKCIKTW